MAGVPPLSLSVMLKGEEKMNRLRKTIGQRDMVSARASDQDDSGDVGSREDAVRCQQATAEYVAIVPILSGSFCSYKEA